VGNATAQRPDCPYYYEDYYRGRETRACRLIERNPRSRPWKPSLCATCPVPRIIRETRVPYLALEATVTRRFFRERVTVFAVCTKHLRKLDNPLICPDCEAERAEQGGS